jgi:hypothetical protein
VRMRVSRVVAAVLAAGVLVAGCGGPDQAGAAVIIDGDVVPLAGVQSQLETALSRPERLAELTAQGGGPADVARSIVSREVMHELLQRRAAAEGISVSDAQVDTRLEESGGVQAALESSIYDLPALRSRVRDDLIAVALAERSVGGLSVTADLVAVTSRDEAVTTAETLAAGGPVADALFGNPQTSARGTVYDAVTAPDAAGTVLFGTPVGGVVAFQPDQRQSTWIIFKVTDRRTDAPFDQQAVSAISSTQKVTIGERLLQPDAERLDVRVNPRYGVWDPIQLRVVAEDAVSGVILPPAAAAPASAGS